MSAYINDMSTGKRKSLKLTIIALKYFRINYGDQRFYNLKASAKLD